MLDILEITNYVCASAGVVLLFVTILVTLDVGTKKFLFPYIKAFGLYVAFLFILTGSSLALVYSDVFGIVPCGLCWLERIALFPQLIIVGIALYYREYASIRSGIALSVVGFIIAAYHHYIQMGGGEFVRCPTSGADCSMRFMYEFGFVTFPLLAALSFAFLIVLYMYVLKTQNDAH